MHFVLAEYLLSLCDVTPFSHAPLQLTISHHSEVMLDLTKSSDQLEIQDCSEAYPEPFVEVVHAKMVPYHKDSTNIPQARNA
jgi:hypothetical protein